MGLTGGALGRSGFLPGRPVLHVWHLGGAGICVRGGWGDDRCGRPVGTSAGAGRKLRPPGPPTLHRQAPSRANAPPALHPTRSSPLPLPSASPSPSPPPPPLPVSCSPPLPSPPPPPARPLWLALRRRAGRRLRLNHLGAGPGAGPGSWAEPLSQLVGPSRSPGPLTPPRARVGAPGIRKQTARVPRQRGTRAARPLHRPPTTCRRRSGRDRGGTGAGPSRLPSALLSSRGQGLGLWGSLRSTGGGPGTSNPPASA